MKKEKNIKEYRLSGMQENLFFQYLMDQSSTNYLIQFIEDVYYCLDEKMVLSTLEFLVDKHEILRTAILYEAGSELTQTIISDRNIEIHTFDYSNENVQKQELMIKELEKQELARGFDLEKDALFRVVMIRLSSEHFQFLCTCHHIIFDKWSIQVLCKDFVEIYKALQFGKSSDWIYKNLIAQKEDGRCFSDYIDWLTGQDSEKGLNYWKTLLFDYENIAEIGPSEFIKDSCKYIDKMTNRIAGEEYSKLLNFSQKHDVSLSVIFQLAVGIVLQNYNYTNDVVFGKVISGRSNEIKGIRDMVGLFFNTIPVRVKNEENITVMQLIMQLKEQEEKSERYFYSSLSDVQNVTAQKKDLIKVLYLFQDLDQENKELGKLIDLKKLKKITTWEHSGYPIAFCFYVENGEVNIELLFEKDRYTYEDADSIFRRFQIVLKRILETPKDRVSEIEIISEEEKEQIIDCFNSTMTTYDKRRTIIPLFERVVAEGTQNLAISFLEQSLTYEELNHKANQLAAKLRNMGVQRNSIVAIQAVKSVEMIIAILGVWKSGAAYVPIDPTYPKTRVDFIIKDCNAVVVLTYGTKLSVDIPVIELEETQLWTCDVDNLEVINKPEDLAYIIYTSGTTGTPKGVMINHSSVVVFSDYVNQIFEMSKSDRVLQFANYIFDASVFEIVGALLSGAALVIVSKEIIADISAFEDFIEKNEISFSVLPPQYYIQTEMKGIRILATGGSASNIELVKKAERNQCYVNVYGPTESTVVATYWKHFKGEDIPQNIPIGKPVPNTKVFIRNGNKLCPIGIPGEMCLAGEGLALGYLNQKELTQEKFIDNPYGEGKLYKTGDLAKWNSDGTIGYLGRIDEQVKIRGFRIEPGEIEDAVRKIEDVIDVAVLAKTDNTGEKALYCYYTADRIIEIDKIRAELEIMLPAYMVPSYIMQIPQIPLTLNGKLDKSRLPEIQVFSDEEYVAPQNEIQEQLCKTFCEVLHVKEVGIHDNFFRLGGDSIKAIRVVSKMKAKNYAIRVSDIMKGCTVEEIEKAVASIENETIYQQEDVVGRARETQIIRKFKNWKLPVPSHFNQDAMLKIQTDDKGIVQRALDELMIHHDALRAVFKEGALLFKSSEEANMCKLEYFDIQERYLTDPIVEAACTKLQASFDLAKGPLMKAAMFHTSEGNYLFICIHHLVIDGVSWRILLEDFEHIVNSLKDGTKVSLPAKTASFLEWTEALEEYAHSDLLKKEKKYWECVEQQVYSGRIEKKQDKPQKGYGTITFQLNEKDTYELVHNCYRAFGTRLNELLLSALVTAVRKLTQQEQVSIALEGHGRETIHKKIDISRTVGWFTSIYPVVFSCYDNVRKTIIETKETIRKIPNNGLGYGILLSDDILDACSLSFNYLGHMDADADAVFNVSGERTAKENNASFPITFTGAIEKQCMQFTIKFDLESYSEEYIGTLVQLVQEGIGKVITCCTDVKETVKTPADYSDWELDMDDLERINQEFEGQQEIEDIYPLTNLQHGILYLKLTDKKSDEYIIQNSYEMSGIHYREELFQEALNLLCQKQEVLRTAIVYKDIRTPKQVILKNRKIEYKWISLLNMDGNQQTREIEKFKKQDLMRGFSLSKDSLIRVTVFQLGKEEYEVLWTMHHIILDGWCLELIFRDLKSYYSRLLRQESVEKILSNIKEEKKRRAPFSSYVKWLAAQDKEKGLKYWKNMLSDYSSMAGIAPIQSPEQTDLQTMVYNRTIQKENTKKLIQLAASNSVTMNTLVETAWGILLQRYNHTEDVVFGKVVSGRDVNLSGIENTVGLYINTVLLRVRCESGQLFSSLLKEIRKQENESDQYWYCSMADIQAVTQQRSDLVKTLFVYENYLNDTEEDTELPMKLKNTREQTNYPISIVSGVKNEELYCQIMYNPNEYRKEEIEDILIKFCCILENIADRPAIKVSDIELLTEQEHEKIVKQFNNTATKYPKDKTVAMLLEEQVAQTPDRCALIYKDTMMTYRELDEKAEHLAQELISLGVGRGDFVAVLAQKSLEVIIGICAILKAGGAYVPIDITYPKERVNYIMEDCKPKAVLVYDYCLDTKVPLIDLQDVDSWDKAVKCTKKKSKAKPEDLAYCIYTSGTTGKPKGSLIANRNIVRLVKNTNYMTFGPNIRLLQTGSVAFDASTFEIWGTLLNGGTLVMADQDVLTVKQQLQESLKRYEINTMWLTSSLFNQMIQIDNSIFDDLDTLLIGGEKLSEEHVRMLKGRNNGVRLLNGYGPTENTTFTTVYEIPDEFDNIPIGKPISNTQVYIMENQHLCPIGIPGELCIAGDGLSSGYLNQKVLTEEKFKENPFGSGKLYRSGDLARWLPDGNIEYLGRIDKQVKIRGFRIELTEIRNIMMKLDAIEDAAVIARNDSSGEKAIYAYYVSKNRITENEIMNWLRQVLPTYMLPSYLRQIDRMPVTENGKLDERALPEIEQISREAYVAPRNVEEEIMCEIFEEVLNVNKVGIHDNFFELGGHSLKITRLINLVEEKTGSRLLIKKVFQNPTPELLANISFSEEQFYQPLPHAEAKELYAMSSAQKRVYFVSELDEGGISYNIPQFFRLYGTVDVEKIKNALQTILDRYEILRTGFLIEVGEPYQKIYQHVNADFQFEKDEYTEEKKLLQEFVRPFRLDQPPLVHMKLVERNDCYLLMIEMHHIISDGISLKIFLQELMNIYNDASLETVNYHYKDYSEWFKTRDLSVCEHYWMEQFKGDIPILDFPLDYRRPKTQTFRGTIIKKGLGSELSRLLESQAKELNVTEYMIFVTGAMILLHKYSKQQDIIIGCPISGRVHKDVENMMGMFVNTLALRGKPEENKTYLQLLQEMKRVCIDAYEHQEYPFEKMVEKLDIQRDVSRNPLFDVLVELQNNEQPVFDFHGFDVECISPESTISKCDMKFDMCKEQDEYVVSFEYCIDLFSEESAEYILEHYINVLKNCIAEPALEIGQIQVAGQWEQQLIIKEFNDNKMPYDREYTVVDLFQDQVRLHPNRVALTSETENVSFQQLDELSERIASKLVSAGIGKNSFVAILAVRCKEMIAAILGVLKAGAAYVPIDPMNPMARIQYIIEDCSASAVLYAGIDFEITSVVPKQCIKINLWELEGSENTVEVKQESRPTQSSLAYAIYTSGTTGKPKGVMIEHGSLYTNILYSSIRFLDKNENIVVPLFTNYCFDLTVPSIYLPLCFGGTMELIPVDMDTNIGYILGRKKYTFVKMTPSLLKTIFTSNEMIYFPDCMVLGGEILEQIVVDELYERFGNQIKLLNEYGPTEATVGSTLYLCDSRNKQNAVPIGKPFANLQIYIMEKDCLCGVGIPGEICIAGDQVAKGYLNNEALTNEKFTKNCYGTGKLYHTGDLARWQPDGNISYIGRMDEQIKVHGYRIETGEIRSVIKDISGVQDAVVIVKNDHNGDKAIYAYYVAEYSLPESDVREALRKRLPEYMVPAYMMQLECIPVTRNGKADVKKLPDITIVSKTEYRKPENAMQEVLCNIFSEVLGIEKVGIRDNFFELGGDSIKAIRIVSKAREHNCQISIRDIMNKHTVEALSVVAKTLRMGHYEQNQVIGTVGSVPILNDFIKRKMTKPELYCQTMMVKTMLDSPEQLKEVLYTLALHHDMLRAVYREEKLMILDGSKESIFGLKVVSLTGQEDKERIIREECKKVLKCIDLYNGPLWQNCFFAGEEERYVFMCIHHLVIDTYSWQILIEDFRTAERAVLAGKKIHLPEKTASYISWAEGLMKYKEEISEEETAYWHEIASKGCQGCIKMQPETYVDEIGSVKVKLTSDETKSLLYQAVKNINAEMNVILLGALANAVYNTTHQDVVTVGMEGHGREEFERMLEVDRTIGWFTIKYPVMLNCTVDIKECIARAKETFGQLFKHGLGYGLIEGDYQCIPGDISFNYLGSVDGDKESSFEIGQNLQAAGGNQENISITCYMEDNQLTILSIFKKSHFSETNITMLLTQYLESLKEIVGICKAVQTSVISAHITATDLSKEDYKYIIEHYEVDDIYSLTPLQAGMLYEHITNTESTNYVTQVVYSLQSKMNRLLIYKALDLLLARHDVLRTSIIYKDIDVPRQVLISSRKIDIKEVNLTTLRQQEQMKRVHELEQENIKRGFVLDQDPLLRIIIVTLGESNYRIIWSYHHIIFDGWCSNLLFGDFISFYRRLLAKESYEDIWSEIQNTKQKSATYGDYTEWLKQQDQEQCSEYWRNYLSDYEGIADIKPMVLPQETDVQMMRTRQSLSLEMSYRLKNLAIASNVTVNTVMQSALGLLLQLYNYTDDVVFGNVISGRNAQLKGIEEIVGLFVNTVPVRVKRNDEMTFREMLKQLQKENIESSSYDFYSLTEIQNQTNQKGSLIQILYAFENFYINQEKLDSDEQFRYEIVQAREQTNYPITFSVSVENNQIHSDILFDPRIYVEEEIQGIQDKFLKILENMVKRPDAKICDMDALTDHDQNLILEVFNDTTTEYPNSKTVVELLQEQVEEGPERIALIFKARSLTYRCLDVMAENLATKLTLNGVSRGDRVVVMAEKSVEIVLALCAILKAGGAYVPIDTSYPAERVRFIIGDCKPKVVLVYQHSIETEVPVIDLADSEVWEESVETVEKSVYRDPADLAYIIYTSGTTGNPKGSLIENRSIVRLVKNTNYIKLSDKTRILQTGSVAFDASTFEIWGALLNGGTLVMAETEVLTSSDYLKKYISSYQINTMWLTSSLFNQMIQIDHSMFDSLDTLLIGGEKLSEEHVRIMKEQKNGVRLLNGYGPTENTTFTTVYEIPEDFKSIPIGKPIANTKVYILNGKHLCPVGIPGELCIAGDGLAKGYLNQKELTDEKFVDNPFGKGKLYRSGDLARWMPDGNIEYLGRIDQQVKIRGFRIELTEIRNIMMKQESIEDAAVIAKEDSTGDKAIYAYYVSKKEISEKEVKDLLREALPQYMLPTYMAQIEKIPVTRNGKLDERALPDIEHQSEEDYVEPRDEKEKALCKVFEEVLGVKKVGIYDNFFTLGGDSIKAIRIVSKYRNAGYVISVKDIMEQYIVEAIAVRANIQGDQNYFQGETNGIVKSTPIIRQFVKWNLVIPSHFNQDITLATSLLPEDMSKVLDALWNHHDILRSVFRDNTLVILSSKEARKYDFNVYDLTDSSDAFKEMQQICDELQKGINLFKGPLMRTAYFLMEETNYIFICMHHLIVDGVSWRILLEDIETAMEQITDGKDIELPPKTASYIQWAECLDEYAKSDSMRKQKVYWEKVVHELEDASLEVSKGEDIPEVYQCELQLNEECTHALIYEAGKSFNTEINDLLISALCMAVRVFTGQERIGIAMEGHGREEISSTVGIDRTVGWFTSIYPVVLECLDDEEQSIVSVKETLRKIPEHGIGYGLLYDDVKADLYFNYLGVLDEESGKSRDVMYLQGKACAEENILHRPINISGGITGGKLTFTIQVENNFIGHTEMIEFSELYQASLVSLIQFCEESNEEKRTLSDLYASDLKQEDLQIINELFD